MPMIKEMLSLRSWSAKFKKLGIDSIKSFLEHCQDLKAADDLRIQLNINVTSEQWLGAIAVVKELFK